MKLLAHLLCLCLPLALAWADLVETDTGSHDGHHHHHHHHHHPGDVPERCQGLEMDAVTVNKAGVPYFFKGEYLFKGFQGHAELSNESFSWLDEFHLGSFGAAFSMHHMGNSSMDDHLFLFSGHMVFNLHENKLVEGFPKNISSEFPGIPDDLDAAVECPKEDCGEDDIIFFKRDKIFHFNIQTKAVEEKEFDSMPNCTSAFRFMEHYYCFHGHMFSRFDPKTGFVHGRYPKEARDYFMKCSHYGDNSNHVERERCSLVHLDAITADGAGNIYAFRGHNLIHKDGLNGTLTVDTIERAFSGLHSDVDAAIIYDNHFFMSKDDQMFMYRMDEPHTLVNGFPKPIRELFTLNGPFQAAFVDDDHITQIIKGHSMISVNMTTTPFTSIIEHPVFSFESVDAAMFHDGVVKVFVGNYFYNFTNPMDVTGTSVPQPHKVSVDLFGCDH